MQEWWNNNDNLMYSTHNEDKSVIGETLKVKTLRAKIYRKMTANDSESYFSHLNKLVDQYNNTCHHLLIKNINADYSSLTEKIGTNKLRVNARVKITKYKSIFSNVCTENWSWKIFIINFVLKLMLGIKKLKI